MPTPVRSYCKINLGLAIGPPRADGFHGLATLYQTLELHDVVTVAARRVGSPAEAALRLTSNDERVPLDHRNTAWKMVALALERLGIAADVAIHIEKNLPVQGGLGGGSANAVAALMGLERELGVALPGPQRMELAAEVGSDVPLFLLGGAVLGMGRGEEIYPFPDLPATHCVVVAPGIGVSTPQAFRDWDTLCREEESARDAQNDPNALTRQPIDDRIEWLSRVYAGACAQADFPREAVARADSSGVLPLGPDLAGPLVSALVRTGIGNDFERVVFARHPFLSEIKRILAAVGTPEESLYASLSGSGSSLFGLYRGQEQAEAVRNRLRGMGVDALVTHTLSRSAYWSEMLLPSGG